MWNPQAFDDNTASRQNKFLNVGRHHCTWEVCSRIPVPRRQPPRTQRRRISTKEKRRRCIWIRVFSVGFDNSLSFDSINFSHTYIKHSDSPQDTTRCSDMTVHPEDCFYGGRRSPSFKSPLISPPILYVMNFSVRGSCDMTSDIC